MTDVEGLREQQAVELEVAELSAELVALKAGGDADRLVTVKNRLRELRIVLRLRREGWIVTADGGLERDPDFDYDPDFQEAAGSGDAVVAPGTVNVTSAAHGSGEA